jgi:hypothetical protein
MRAAKYSLFQTHPGKRERAAKVHSCSREEPKTRAGTNAARKISNQNPITAKLNLSVQVQLQCDVQTQRRNKSNEQGRQHARRTVNLSEMQLWVNRPAFRKTQY